MMPQSQGHTPFTGWEGIANRFGPIPSMFAQMGMQTMFGSSWQQNSMAPFGLSGTNIADRLRHNSFSKLHDDFIREQARLDESNYIQAMQGTAAMFGTPWMAEQQAMANSVAAGISNFSPMLVQMNPQILDQASGMRGSRAVMAHHMSLAGRHRIDAATGAIGASNASMSAIMNEVYDGMLGGENYRDQSLSAGQLGSLFQELSMRGMAPRASTLQQLASARPGRLSRLMAEAGIDGIDGNTDVSQISAADRDKIMQSTGVQAELASFDGGQIKDTLSKWSKSITAMKEIFGDAGHPNAPMPELINSINQLTGNALSQLNPTQVNDMVRLTQNLATNSGLGMEAAMMMTQNSVQQASAMGLDPIFGARAAQSTMAFTAAYQGLGLGSYPAWGRGDMSRHQSQHNQLMLAASNSAVSNQMGAADRLNALATFDVDSKAAAYLEAAQTGQSGFSWGGNDYSVDMRAGEFASMIAAGSGQLHYGQAMRYLQQTNANRGSTAANPLMDLATRRAQGAEFISQYKGIGANSFASMLRDRLAPGTDISQFSGVAAALGETSLAGYMSSGTGTATNIGARNAHSGEAMAIKLQTLAAGGDAQAQAILAHFGDELDPFLAASADAMLGATDSQLVRWGKKSLQDQHAMHGSEVLHHLGRQTAKSRAHGLLQDSLAPLGKGTILRRATEALMHTRPGDENPLSSVLAASIGVVSGAEIERLFKDGELNSLHSKYQQLEMMEKEIGNAATPEEATRLQKLHGTRIAALKNEVNAFHATMEDAGLAGGSQMTADVTGRVNRSAIYMRNRATTGKLTATDARTHSRSISDLVAGLSADKNLMQRIGQTPEEASNRLSALRESNLELQVLAQDSHGGDLRAAMSSKAGQKIMATQVEHTVWFSQQAGDRSNDLAYLGTDGAKLTELARTLRSTKNSLSGTATGLLREASDEKIAAWRKKDLITESQARMLRRNRKIWTEVGDKHSEITAEWAKEGQNSFKNALRAVTDRDMDSIIDPLAATDEGQEMTKFAQGSGVDSMAWRAYLKSLGEDARIWNSKDRANLSTAEKKAMRAKHGELLDMDFNVTRSSNAEMMQALKRKYDQFAPKAEKAGEDADEGVKRIEIAHMHITGKTASIELQRESPV